MNILRRHRVARQAQVLHHVRADIACAAHHQNVQVVLHKIRRLQSEAVDHLLATYPWTGISCAPSSLAARWSKVSSGPWRAWSASATCRQSA